MKVPRRQKPWSSADTFLEQEEIFLRSRPISGRMRGMLSSLLNHSLLFHLINAPVANGREQMSLDRENQQDKAE